MSVDFQWNGDKAIAGFRAGKQAGLRMAAEAVLDEARERTPVAETGELQGNSGTAVSGDEAAIYYNAIYAVYQHEGIGFNRPNGGQAKFLETAVTAKQGEVGQIIANAVKRGMGA